MFAIDGYKVIKFDYSAMDKIFMITAEQKDTGKIITVGIHNPSENEITNAIDMYVNCGVVSLSILLSCFI